MSRESEQFGGHESVRHQKKERDFGGDKGRKRRKRKEVASGQAKNSLVRHEHGEKTPEAEIKWVLGSVMRRDEGNLEMLETKKYISWLMEKLTVVDTDFTKEIYGEFEKLTASVKAGGGGRQTSRNSRARTHLITGIREKSEKDRKAHPNELMVMKKLEESIKKHIDNWRIVLKADPRFDKNFVLLDEKVLETMAELELAKG